MHIWTPQKSDNGKDVYSVTMIFEPEDDLSEMMALAKATKEAKWGQKPPGKLKNPFRKGTEDEFDLSKNPEYKGKVIVTARSYERPPGVVYLNRKPILDRNDFFSGCYGIASLTAFAFENDKNKGVSFSLQNIMMTRKGEPFVAKSNPEEDFAEIDTSRYGDDADLFGGLDALDDL